MFKLLNALFKKSCIENANDNMYADQGESSYDMASNRVQDNKNNYEYAYELKLTEENIQFIEINDVIEKKIQKEEYDKCISYYCAINDPIAEIVILEYFTQFVKVEKIKNVFADDFSVNYRIEIPVALIDIQSLLCFMFMSKYITPPATFGIVLADVFGVYNYVGGKTDIEKVFEISLENYKKRNPNATEEELNTFRSKGKRKIDSYIVHDENVRIVVEKLRKRISSDKYKAIEKYCKIYPLRVIEEDRYYVSYVSEKCIKQYIGDNCPKFLYYYMVENRNKYEREYQNVLLSLMEHGLIKSRWKNEFSLYMLVKSYFSSTIYQYHAEWLGKQSLDIYIPEYKIGIEYQGKQHYEEVELFNGVEGLMETQKRDKLKKEKCKRNGVTLIEWIYTDEVEEKKLIDVLKRNNIPIPPKNDYVTYFKDNMNSPSISNDRTSKKELSRVCQYDLEGNYLNSYDSIDVAASETAISKDNIRKVCSGIRKSGGGYMWRRYFEIEIPQKIEAYSPKEQSGCSRKIIQCGTSGEIIASYDSVSEAARKTGINVKSIRETARGKQNHAGGYVWKYADID